MCFLDLGWQLSELFRSSLDFYSALSFSDSHLTFNSYIKPFILRMLRANSVLITWLINCANPQRKQQKCKQESHNERL